MRLFFLSWLLCVTLTAPLRAESILVFAAVSLSGPLDAIAVAWEAETGHSVTRVYAGSSAIARQVEAGAPADIVFLASQDWMDYLSESGVIMDSSIRQILSNRLVMVMNTRAHGELDLNTVPTGRDDWRIALALTDAVPAGIYARAALEASGVWEELRDQVVEADNVRAVTRLVAIGAVERGIVYETEAQSEPRVTVLSIIPEDLHPPIRYPAALTPDSSEQAATFLAYLESRAARTIFRNAGFGLIER